jgi:hypothetical protein
MKECWWILRDNFFFIEPRRRHTALPRKGHWLQTALKAVLPPQQRLRRNSDFHSIVSENITRFLAVRLVILPHSSVYCFLFVTLLHFLCIHDITFTEMFKFNEIILVSFGCVWNFHCAFPWSGYVVRRCGVSSDSDGGQNLNIWMVAVYIYCIRNHGQPTRAVLRFGDWAGGLKSPCHNR